MRHEWYGDKRDLVKWGTVIHLCERFNLGMVIQIAFLREFTRELRITTNLKGEDFTLSKVVWDHLRNIHHVQALGAKAGVDVRIFERRFDPTRRADYCEAALAEIRNSGEDRKVVLLDPDTGIAPSGKPAAEHVTAEEVRKYWDALNNRDWLVLYQHAARQHDWVTVRRDAFATACHNPNVHTFQSPMLAGDVAFFAAEKLGTAS